MSDTLLELFRGAVSNDVLDKMAELLGQPADKTASALSTAAGTLIGGLMQKTRTSDGARDVFNSVQQHDDDVLEKLGEILAQGEADNKLHREGVGVLQNVFGSDQSATVRALAGFFGIDENRVASLLSMAAPIVMGVIKRYATQKSLDAASLASFLGEQTKSLGAVVPPELAAQLGLGEIVEIESSATIPASSVVESGSRPQPQRTSNVDHEFADTAEAGASLLKLIIPLILLGIIAWLGYTFLLQPDGDLASNQNARSQAAKPTGGPVERAEIDAIQSQLAQITDQFADVSSENAQQLAQNMADLNSALKTTEIRQWPDAAKSALRSSIEQFKSSVETTFDKISDESVRTALRTPTEKLIATLDSLDLG